MNTKTSFYLMHRSEQTHWLRENHPNAFLLLTIIAERARWNEKNLTGGLKPLQCVLGTTEILWKGCTRKILRGAIKTLIQGHQIVTKTTTKGTIVTLVGTDVVQVNVNTKGQQRANEGPTEDINGATNLKGYKKIEGYNLDLPLYFTNDVIHALAIELKKGDAETKRLTEEFVKHCGVLKTTYSKNAAFALQRDFKDYAETHRATERLVPYGVVYYK
jgi:hypothetical protein